MPLHPEQLCRMVRENKADIGIAHDGDADRVLLCDERGQVIDGDDIIAIIGLERLAANALPNDPACKRKGAPGSKFKSVMVFCDGNACESGGVISNRYWPGVTSGKRNTPAGNVYTVPPASVTCEPVVIVAG